MTNELSKLVWLGHHTYITTLSKDPSNIPSLPPKNKCLGGGGWGLMQRNKQHCVQCCHRELRACHPTEFLPLSKGEGIFLIPAVENTSSGNIYYAPIKCQKPDQRIKDSPLLSSVRHPLFRMRHPSKQYELKECTIKILNEEQGLHLHGPL